MDHARPVPRTPSGRRSPSARVTAVAAALAAAVVGTLAVPVDAEAVIVRGGTATASAGASPVPAVAVASTARVAISSDVTGTWVLVHADTVAALNEQRPQIRTALAVPGVSGMTLEFPWSAADLPGTATTHPLLDTAASIATANGSRLSLRFLSGVHAPARATRGAATATTAAGEQVPLPFDSGAGEAGVYVAAWSQYVGRLAAWSRDHDVAMLHLPWFGSELDASRRTRSAPGYSAAGWLRGHGELLAAASSRAGRGLAMEMPLSGTGPLHRGLAASVADEVLDRVGANNRAFFVQANGWDESGEWRGGRARERALDRIWSRPVMRGLQPSTAAGRDWAAAFDRLEATRASYAQVQLDSFFAGAVAENGSATVQRLRDEVAVFGGVRRASSNGDPDPAPAAPSYGTGDVQITTDEGVPVLVRYPTTGDTMAPRRPLIVAGHGSLTPPAQALDSQTHLVQAGYVVAVPDLNTPVSPGRASKARLISATIDAVLESPRLEAGVLANRIGFTGGSLGAFVGLQMVKEPCRDDRIDVMVLRSGAVAGSQPSAEEWRRAPAMLFVHGRADNAVPYADGRAAFLAADDPKAMISLAGAGHDLRTGTDIVGRSTRAVFARFLRGEANALADIDAAAEGNDVVTYEPAWGSAR